MCISRSIWILSGLKKAAWAMLTRIWIWLQGREFFLLENIFFKTGLRIWAWSVVDYGVNVKPNPLAKTGPGSSHQEKFNSFQLNYQLDIFQRDFGSGFLSQTLIRSFGKPGYVFNRSNRTWDENIKRQIEFFLGFWIWAKYPNPGTKTYVPPKPYSWTQFSEVSS